MCEFSTNPIQERSRYGPNLYALDLLSQQPSCRSAQHAAHLHGATDAALLSSLLLNKIAKKIVNGSVCRQQASVRRARARVENNNKRQKTAVNQSQATISGILQTRGRLKGPSSMSDVRNGDRREPNMTRHNQSTSNSSVKKD